MKQRGLSSPGGCKHAAGSVLNNLNQMLPQLLGHNTAPILS